MGRAPSRPVLRPVIAVFLATPLALAGCFGLGDPKGGPGDWGKDFLSALDHDRLVVEIDHESGAAPDATALSGLRDNLERFLNKPKGIEIRTATQEVPAKGASHKWSFSSIRSLEDDIRNDRKGGDTMVLYVLYVAGGSADDSDSGRVLGAAYSGSSIVMFKENIKRVRDQCFNLPIGCPSAGTIEKAVLVHELGHILGLVNNGIPMVTPHEDPSSKHHSSNQDSVMYWKVETGDIIDLIQGRGLPTEFDEKDRADMKAAGGK